MKLIEEKELERLILASEILNRLDEGGVDKWERYRDAIDPKENSLDEWEACILPQIVDSYESA